MNNAASQMVFGPMSGIVPVEPFAVSDIIVHKNGRRAVVTHVDSNDAGAVMVCIYLDTGTDGIILDRMSRAKQVRGNDYSAGRSFHPAYAKALSEPLRHPHDSQR